MEAYAVMTTKEEVEKWVEPRAVCEHYCDRAWHKAQTARTPATVVLRCQGCGRVIARCTACEEGYPPGNAAATMRAHLRSSYCLSRAARGRR